MVPGIQQVMPSECYSANQVLLLVLLLPNRNTWFLWYLLIQPEVTLYMHTFQPDKSYLPL